MSVNTQTSDIIFGLVNVKNSCYLNAAMQALLSVGSLSLFINDEQSKSNVSIRSAISIFMESCRKGENFKPVSILKLNLFKEKKGNIGKSQQDVTEWLVIFLPLINFFPGFQVHLFRECTACSKECSSDTAETIELTFNEKCTTFEESMKNFMQDELDDVDCDVCCRKTRKKQYRTFLGASSVVQINIKRFNNSVRKVQGPIDIPFEVKFEINFEEIWYSLKAFIVHQGMK